MVGASGDGVAAGPIFVPLTLPGEQVRARVTDGRGEVEALLTVSSERVPPPCPHFGQCGGCALQHWADGPALAWKVDQIRASLARVGLDPHILPAYAAAPGTRRRIALHARRGEGGGVVLGFKGRRSWRVTPIETCAVAAPALVDALPALARLAEPFLLHPASAPTLHVTASLTGLDVNISGIERRRGGPSADGLAAIAPLAVAADLARVTLAGETLYQARQPVVRFGPATVVLPAGGFLQASAAAEEAIAGYLVEQARGARRIADLFCGSGAFTFRLATHAAVSALDASAGAVAALANAARGVDRLRPISAAGRDLERRPLSPRELAEFDLAVFDPPRAGAAPQAAALAASPVARVLAVSCNPATFARDAQILCAGGFFLVEVLPVDQFLWSPHIELAALFVRRRG